MKHSPIKNITKHNLKKFCDSFNDRSLNCGGINTERNELTPMEFMFSVIMDANISNKLRKTAYRMIKPYVYEGFCENCGKLFIEIPGVNNHCKKYCSNDCRKEKELKNKWKVFMCQWCGKEFKSQQSAQKYCSFGCSGIVRSIKNEQLRIKYKCKSCGGLFFRPLKNGHGDSHSYCSRECAGVGTIGDAKTKRYSYSGSARHRAKEWGVKYTNFNILDIFEIDGWRCRICGRKLDPNKRGTTYKFAPEIDHIIPISLGGDHVPENVQSVCRKCNLKKSNNNSYGQLVLPMFNIFNNKEM